MAYYGFGSKETIMLYFGALLNTITGIQFVDWQRVLATGVGPENYPGIFVNDVNEVKTKVLKDIFRNEASIALVCWIWASNDENLGTKLNTFVEAVKTKIQVDTTCGNQAYDTVIGTISSDGGNKHPQGIVVLMLNVMYFTMV